MGPKGTKQQLEFRRRVALALLDTGWEPELNAVEHC
jgi:hypothetical protein